MCRLSASIGDACVYLQRAVASENYGDRAMGVGVVFLYTTDTRGESPSSGTNSTRVLGVETELRQREERESTGGILWGMREHCKKIAGFLCID